LEESSSFIRLRWFIDLFPPFWPILTNIFGDVMALGGSISSPGASSSVPHPLNYSLFLRARAIGWFFASPFFYVG
jgi:hypothetical protein